MKNLSLEHEELLALQSKLQDMNPVDLAEYISDLEEGEKMVCIKLLDKELLADTFSELSPKEKKQIISNFTDNEIEEIFEQLESDELVDTIQELPANMVNKLLNYVSEEKRPMVNRLLGYPRESVGSIMSVEFIRGKVGASKEDPLRQVQVSPVDAKNLELIWIVDQTLKLKGFIFLADLIRLKSPSLEEILNPISAFVRASDDQEIAAKMINKYHLEALPVVDSEGRLVGSVVTESILDVMVDEFEEDLLNLQGISSSSDIPVSYLESSVFSISKKRLSWLLILMFTATITSFLIRRYEAVLASSVALVAYIPVLMDTGGNSGSQSTATIIQALAKNEVEFSDLFSVLMKEIRIGFLVGSIMAVLNFIRVLLMDGVGFITALTVSLTLLITLMISKAIGGVLPLIAARLGQDPTVMAGPLITTLVDTAALVIYFEMAQLLLL